MVHIFGTGYLRTIQGILKICELASSFIGVLLITVNVIGTTDLLNAMVAGFAMGLIITAIIFILYVTALGKNIAHVLAFQIYINLLLFIYLLIVAAILISKKYHDRLTTGGVFGLISAVLYLVDTIDCYRNDRTPIICV